ncbi:carbohydrate ABC transporter permease [Brachybacterium sp. AOP42-C2-15]|uniref:carbohydrate ABC transporter permease n=1 Tax=unclassified Brachybacterium TaxID=2623841 RepID=UPI004033A0E2
MSSLPGKTSRWASLKSRRAAPDRGSVPKYFMLILISIFTAFPFYVMLVLAFRSPGPVPFPGALIPAELSLESIRSALSNESIFSWAFNTTVYALVSVVGVLLLASMAGYAFAKMKFRGKEVAFWIVLVTLLIPYHIALIPQFILVSNMGLADTLAGLILPGLANTQALFLMRQFIRGIPDELLEAARIDGASELRVYLSIILPLTKPILATLAVFVFLWNWNDFLWPLVISSSDASRTLTVGLASMRVENVAMSEVMAGALLTLLPALLVFLVMQRYFIRGVAATGVKG